MDNPPPGALERAIVLFNGNAIRAHKINLARGSPYFKTVSGKGAGETKLELNDENPEVVEGLIAYFYGLTYDGVCEYIAGIDFSFGSNSDEYSPICITYLVDLYIVAKKYAVNPLHEKIVAELRTLLRESGASLSLLGSTAFAQRLYLFIDPVIGRIFLQHADTATELRRPVLECVLKRIQHLNKDPDFQQLLRDVPEISVELVQILVNRQSDDMDKNKTSKKRKSDAIDDDDFMTELVKTVTSKRGSPSSGQRAKVRMRAISYAVPLSPRRA